MKKFRWLPALFAALMLAACACAEPLNGIIYAADYATEAFGRGMISQFARVGDGLMLLDTQNEYLSWQSLDGGEPRRRASVIEDETGRKCVWGIAERAGELLAVEAEFSGDVERDYGEVAVYEVPRQAGGAFVQHKRAALDWFGACEEGEEIKTLLAYPDALIVVTTRGRALRFDLASGAGEVILEADCDEALKLDEENYILLEWTENGQAASVRGIQDGAVRASKPLLWGASGFAAAEGKLYFTSSYSLYELPLTGDGEPKAIAGLSIENGEKAMICGGRYLVVSMEELLAFDMRAKPQGKVVVRGPASSEALAGFARENPDIQIVVEHSLDQGEAVTELLTKDASVDVYVLSSADDQTFRTLRDRGYLREIESEALQSFVSGLYPQLQREVTVDGKICGVPVSMFVQDAGMSVNLAAWEKLGLKREELPGSWRELMRFILERWPQMQADAEAKGVCLASYPGNIGEHFLWARESQCPEPGEPVYATPDMIYCYAGYSQSVRQGLYPEEDFMGVALFQPAIWEALGTGGYVPLPLTMDSEPTHSSVTVDIMVINPYSERVDAAQRLIEYCVANLRPEEAVMMSPENNAPVENAGHADRLREAEELAARYDARIAAAEGEAERRILAEEKDRRMQQEMEYVEQARWDVSPEEIAAYRALLEDFAIHYNMDPPDGVGRDLWDLLEQFEAGEIDAETYAKAMDRAYVMSAMEDAAGSAR